MRFTPLVGTLAYIWDEASDNVLLVRRNARPDDDQFGKVNGLGGKLETDESVAASLRRELDEEAGIELTEFALRGTITWTNFGPKREQWLAFIFLVTGWDGEPPARNEEGSLEWVARGQLLDACRPDRKPELRDATFRSEAKLDGTQRVPELDQTLPLWAGDRHFIPLVFDGNPQAFHGTMPYDGDTPLSWHYERI